MRKAPRDNRDELTAMLTIQQPPAVTKGTVALSAEGKGTDGAQAVADLADALKRHPARLRPDRGFNYQLYMLGLVDGGRTLLADEPIPDQVCTGLARWSHDGRRIVFETMGPDGPWRD